MPRALDLVAFELALVERAAIVRAQIVDGVELRRRRCTPRPRGRRPEHRHPLRRNVGHAWPRSARSSCARPSVGDGRPDRLLHARAARVCRASTGRSPRRSAARRTAIQAAALQIEQHLGIDGPDGRAVRAADDVVVQDLELGIRVGLGAIGQQDVLLLLARLGLVRRLVDADQTR